MEYHWSDFVGNLGVAFVLVPYLLLQLDRLGAKTPAYSLLNGLGALLILVSLYFNFNLSSVIIELFWLLFSVIGLVRYRGGNAPEGDHSTS